MFDCCLLVLSLTHKQGGHSYRNLHKWLCCDRLALVAWSDRGGEKFSSERCQAALFWHKEEWGTQDEPFPLGLCLIWPLQETDYQQVRVHAKGSIDFFPPFTAVWVVNKSLILSHKKRVNGQLIDGLCTASVQLKLAGETIVLKTWLDGPL